MHRLPEEPDDRVHARLDAAEAVVVAVVPGRVGVEHRGEPGHVARGDGLEAGADGVDVGGGGARRSGDGLCGHDVLLSRMWMLSGATLGAVGTRPASTVRSISAVSRSDSASVRRQAVAHGEHRQTRPGRDAALGVDVHRVGVHGRVRDEQLGGDLRAWCARPPSRRSTSSSRSVRSTGSGGNDARGASAAS